MSLRMSLHSWSNFTGDERICAHVWTRTDTNGHICRHMNESTDEFPVMVKFHEATNIYMHTYGHVWTCMDTYVDICMSLQMILQLSCRTYICTHMKIYGHICRHMNKSTDDIIIMVRFYEVMNICVHTWQHIWTHRYTHEWVYGWVCSHGRGDEHIYAHIWTCMNTYRNICRHMNESTDDLAVKLLNVYMHTYEDIWTHMYAYDWVYGWVCCHDQILQDDEYTCASAESLVFLGYLVPGPLSKSLVQTLNHIVWIKGRWGNWGN